MGKDQDLLEAARNGNAVIVEKLLNSRSKRGGPLASLRRGPSSNFQDSSGYSALHHAALNGHREVVALLLEHEASPNIVDNKGSTPLHLAAWAGHADIVRLILTQGVRITQINLRNKDNETALHCGAQYGHSAVVSLLLKYGADPKVRNVRDETALDLAALYGRLETVEALIRTHPELISIYHESARQSLNSVKTTPLHAASRNGHRKVVDALLDAGFPVSIQTSKGTALHEAALCGKVDVVRRLLEAGIDVSPKNHIGLTALRLVQDLPTPVAKEISSLIQHNALKRNHCRATYGDTASTYVNIALSSTYSIQEKHEFQISSATDSFITLPRQRHKPSTSLSTQSQVSDGSFYEVPPPPRSLPWLQRRTTKDTDNAVGFRSSQSDLANGDSLFVTQEGSQFHHLGSSDHSIPHSWDGRSSNLSPSETTYVNNTENSSRKQQRQNGVEASRSAFIRSSQTRHSADQYLPMVSPSTKVSPNPPAKPPRKLQGITTHFENMSLSMGRTNRRPQIQSGPLSTSSSGYELVYLARTGSPSECNDLKSTTPPKFNVQRQMSSNYVEMAPNSNMCYENVVTTIDETYDIPRELGGTKAYENVNLNLSVGADSDGLQSPAHGSTPSSPSKIHQPPTPDHPPPPAHLAEQSIHLRIRPLSEELKRKSRDIETETEEELFVTLSNTSPETAGSGSASLSPSEQSASTDYIEEVTSDIPFEGLMRGSVPPKRVLARPKSLQTTNPASGHLWASKRATVDHCSMTDGSSSGQRRPANSLCVLSPFDEQEEWIKILEILSSCNSGFEDGDSNLVDAVQREFQNRIDALNEVTTEVPSDVIDVPIGRYDTVADWLLVMGMQQYLNLLISNGFDDINFLGDGVMDDASLLEIGVCDGEHRRRLVEAAAQLATPLEKMKSSPPSELEEWLHLLRLDHYADLFRKNCFDDMERIHRVWEVELTTVIEIRLLGHLRRILVSLGDSSRANGPINNSGAPLTKAVSSTNDSQQDFKDLTSDLQKISTNIAKLEDEISQRMWDQGETSPTNATKTNGTLGRRKSRRAPLPPSSTPKVHQLERMVDRLAIRNPSELVIGIAKSVATQWRHPPRHLVGPGVCYHAQYLGSTLVRHVRGTESTKRSIQKLKKRQAEDLNKPASIVLAISIGGVQFLNPVTNDSICIHEIRNINWACQDADDLTHFAYITKDQQTEDDHFCHVFRVNTMDLATEIILTLGQAFEVAYQLVLREDIYPAIGHQQQEEPQQQLQQQQEEQRQPQQEQQQQPAPLVLPNPEKLLEEDKERKVSLTSDATVIAAPRKGGKPPELPPKPKFVGTALLNHKNFMENSNLRNSTVNNHTQSNSSISGSSKTLVDNRLRSESNLASLQASKLPSMPSSMSISSTGSGRAPLAAKDEL